MTNKILIKLKEYTYFIWLLSLLFIAVAITYIYDQNKKNQILLLSKSLNNVYLKKTLNTLTSNLKPRYVTKIYKVQKGDTFENIIGSVNLPAQEKKKFYDVIKKQKEIKLLKKNQEVYFKLDTKDTIKILEFKLEIDKKRDLVLLRVNNKKDFISKIIEKNLTKVIVFKEGRIDSSLYNTATELGIKPNTIIEFARLYGFQVDFQRDIWKGDVFQIIFEEYKNKEGIIVDTGDIIYANLKLQNQDLNLYKYEYEKGKIDFFDENGKSVQKTLMKTPINGARLSSSFGKRKHPILGFNKMHTGTDFAAPKGTPIMASGSGVITRARWCGGGGNCIKIKHNSTYQTVYAHLSKFASNIKKGLRVKQAQIIGYVGSTGMSTGPHLHYEVIKNGKKVNSQTLKLPSGKKLKGKNRENFELAKIKINVLKSELINASN